MNLPVIYGSGKGGGGQPQAPKDETNDLRSKSYARVLDLLGYGEWEGLVRKTPGTSKYCDVQAGTKHIGADTTGLSVGQTVQGPGIPNGSVIVSIDISGTFFTIDLDPFLTNNEVLLYFNASSGAESIYLDETPLVNDDGSSNFTGIKYAVTPGTQDQGYISGFDTVENYVSVNTKVRQAAPVTRTITNSDADKCIVELRLPSLYEIKDNGDRVKGRVELRIMVKLNNGSFTLVKNWTIYGKCVADYLEQSEFTLPKSETPESDQWQVKVERITADHEGSSKIADLVFFNAYTEVTTKRFRFPNLVLSGLEVDAENFSRVPVRSWHVKMKKIRVPTNYDPVTRTYATTGPGTTNGGWDGTFKVAYSNNPAWVVYDLCLDKNIGLGRRIATLPDKWGLYEIAKYCDVMVPDGMGGTEPRFTANFYLPTQEQALKVLSDVASIGRMMIYWGRGTLNFVQDRPKASYLQFTNASVKDGIFSYTSTAKRARKSVAFVRYNDPDDFYRPKIQPYEDYEAIFRYGWNPVEVTAFGCTSRGQAYRYGALLINTEKTEYDAVAFAAGPEGALVKPGMILDFFDNKRQLVEGGGRVVSTSGTTQVTLDRNVTLEPGRTYTLTLTVPKLNLESADITDSTQTAGIDATHLEAKTVSTPASTTAALTVSSAFSSVPVGAIWVLTSNAISPQKCRVLSVERISDTEYQISGNRYDPSKFDASEVDPEFELPPILGFPENNVVPPVENLTLTQRSVVTPAGVRTYLDVGWTTPDSYRFYSAFRVSWSFEDGPFTQLTEVQSPGHSFEITTPGRYIVRVTAVSAINRATSVPTQAYYDFGEGSPINSFTITGLEIKGQGNDYIFSGKDVTFAWVLNSPTMARDVGSEPTGAQDGITDPMFDHFLIRVFDTNGAQVYEDRTKSPHYTYTYELNLRNKAAGDNAAVPPFRTFTFEVKAVDRYAKVSRPARIVVSNPAPVVPPVLIEALLGAAQFRFGFPQDTDFRGFRIWASTTNGFTPSDTTLVYDGPDTKPVVYLTAGTLFYIRYAAYDAFGTAGLVLSEQKSVTPLLVLDTLPPAIPTLLAENITSYRTTRGDGTEIIKMRVTWAANTEPDFAGYVLAARESQGFDWITITLRGKDSTAHEFEVRANRRYDFRIRAFDKDNNFSDWSPTISSLSTKDETPPAKPIWDTGFASFRNIYLGWQKNAEEDFAYYELYESETTDFESAVLIAPKLYANSHVVALPLTGEFNGVSRHYWLLAYDTSGNVSPRSERQTVTVGGIATPVITQPIPTEVSTDADGAQRVYILPQWTAATLSEFGAYELEISRLSGQGDYLRIALTNKSIVSYRAEVEGATGYFVRVRVRDTQNGYSAWSSEIYVVSAADTTPPDDPTNFAVTPTMRAALLEWSRPAAKDYAETWLWRYTVSGTPAGEPTHKLGADSMFLDANVSANQTYYWRIKHRDRSGNLSAFSGEVSATIGTVQSSDIADFAITLTKRYHSTVAPQNDAWTNNSPGAGHVSWNQHTLYFQGASYTIAAGDTSSVAANKAYIYWDANTPNGYQVAATNPTLTATQFMIATNVDGAHDLAWNALANAMIGSAYIENLAVTNAKISDLAVDKLTSGTISAQVITMAASGAVNAVIKSSNWDGTLSANNTVSTPGTAGFIFTSNGYGELSNVKIRGDILAGTITIGSNAFRVDNLGNMWVGAESFAAAPFRVDSAGNLTATSASISGVITARALEVGYAIVLGNAGNTSNSTIQSYGFAAGSSGWRILGDGSAEFNNVVMRGSAIIGSTIDGTSTGSLISGANKANAALNGSNNLTTSVIPTTNVAPSGSGLYLGANYMGFFSGGWKTYMNNLGDFYLGGETGALRYFGGSGELRVEGQIHISHASSTINGQSAADVATGGVRAKTGLDNAGKVITAVIPTAIIGPAPSTSGLHLGADYMGYYSNGWKTYIDGAGNFYFKSGSNALVWNGVAFGCSLNSVPLQYNNSATPFYFGVDGTFSLGDKLRFDNAGDLTLTNGKIGSQGLIVTSGVGLRYSSNNGVFTITGGSTNGANNGAQIDLAGNTWADSNAGALVLAAGNVSSGAIHFRTADTIRGKILNDGTADFYGPVKGDSLVATSMRILKTNIRDIEDASKLVRMLKGRQYDWKYEKGRKDDYGFIADEIAEVLPTFVHRDSKGTPVAVDYGRVTSLLVEAFKQLEAKLEKLTNA